MVQCENCDHDTTDDRLGYVRIDCPSGGDAVIDADWCHVCRSEAVARLVADKSAIDPNTDYNTTHKYTPGDLIRDRDGQTWLVQRRLVDIEVPTPDKDYNARSTPNLHRRKYEIVGRGPDDESLHDVVSEFEIERWNRYNDPDEDSGVTAE